MTRSARKSLVCWVFDRLHEDPWDFEELLASRQLWTLYDFLLVTIIRSLNSEPWELAVKYIKK